MAKSSYLSVRVALRRESSHYYLPGDIVAPFDFHLNDLNYRGVLDTTLSDGALLDAVL